MGVKLLVGFVSGLIAMSAWAADPPARAALPNKELQMLAATYQVLQSSFAGKATNEDLIISAIRGMVRLTDREGGDFYTEEEYRDQAGPQAPNNGSIGLELTTRGNMLMVVSPIRGSPAEAAGIRPGDFIAEIDGKRMVDVTPNLAIRLLNGLPGTMVSIDVQREDRGSPLKFDIERKILRLQSAFIERVQPDILSVQVNSFKVDTLSDIAARLQEEWRRRHFKGVLLDLRRNPGGLLNSALGLAAMFLPADAVIASTQGRIAEANRLYKADWVGYSPAGFDPISQLPAGLKKVAVVVLVDEGTASGAEIVAAALKEHKRAIVVGHKTFGWGSIQTIKPIYGGFVKYTSAYWYTSQGHRVDREGVQPQVEINPSERDRELEIAMERLRTLF